MRLMGRNLHEQDDLNLTGRGPYTPGLTRTGSHSDRSCPTQTSRRASGLLVPRHVDLGPPRVVHCKRERHHLYIGRPSKWGNPFVVGRHGTREECIAQYECYLLENEELMAAIVELRGLVLGCWCAPQRCHGDVLMRLANSV
jgi:Domain of unknown function (DUF4326)